jgi:hypothetical protein
MDNLRSFIKKIALNTYKLSIAYRDDYNLFKYVFDDFTLVFKEIDGEVVSLNYNKKTYTDFNEIQLLLFDLFDYKNIEYIDVYLQSKKGIQIEDIYNDFYDDVNKELICIRNIIKDKKIIKIKIIVYNNEEYKLFYNYETIIGIDAIIKKIDELF